MSDRIPETYTEPRTAVRGGTRRNPFVWGLLIIVVVAGIQAGVLLWATSGEVDPDEYDPEGDLFTALGYAWAAVSVMAGLVLLGVKAVLWKPSSAT